MDHPMPPIPKSCLKRASLLYAGQPKKNPPLHPILDSEFVCGMAEFQPPSPNAVIIIKGFVNALQNSATYANRILGELGAERASRTSSEALERER